MAKNKKDSAAEVEESVVEAEAVVEAEEIENEQKEEKSEIRKKNVPIRRSQTKSVNVPRASGLDDPVVFVGVNGVNYIIPRGKTSEVPEAVAAEYERAIEAQTAWDAKSAKMADAK